MSLIVKTFHSESPFREATPNMQLVLFGLKPPLLITDQGSPKTRFYASLEAVAFIEHATSNPDKKTCTCVIPDILLSQEKGSLGS
jgi:hypothetical protein